MRNLFFSLMVIASILLFLKTDLTQFLKNEILKNKKEVKRANEVSGNIMVASGSYYDPWDPRQTKANPDGKGSSGRLIESGSIAMDSASVSILTDNHKKVVFVEITEAIYKEKVNGKICFFVKKLKI